MSRVYVGEGLPPVPPKLAAKILRWEYIEIAEILPEFWSGPKSDEEDPKRPLHRRPRQVTDIFTWINCYASYVSVLSGCFEESVPELMAYMVTITRVSQDFSGLAWVTFNVSFRRQAAITGDGDLVHYHIIARCYHSVSQTTAPCPDISMAWLPPSERLLSMVLGSARDPKGMSKPGVRPHRSSRHSDSGT